ncbi:hypothetical protein Pelo_17642 [Pelomyxa schiedti]|nr:hypothetical protein Pelo_17642 [Pelomyxa schiedti]
MTSEPGLVHAPRRGILLHPGGMKGMRGPGHPLLHALHHLPDHITAKTALLPAIAITLDAQILRLAAYKLMQFKAFGCCVDIFKKILDIRSEEPAGILGPSTGPFGTKQP